MADRRQKWLLLGVVSLMAGCGEGPPLDELPLRDSLRAEPAVVAALAPGARAQLAARLEAARIADSGTDPVAEGSDVGARVGALDDARARRSADALVVGVITDGVGRPVGTVGAPTDPRPLPALEGLVATETASLEARALAGGASGLLRGLLASSGGTRLERVVGWPVGAVAIGDTVYVDAAWLVALAPVDGQADGREDTRGAGDASAAASGAAAGVTPAVASSPTGGTAVSLDFGSSFDAGTYTPPPPPPPPPPSNSPGFLDVCSASCDTGTEDDSSCDTTDDGTDSSCSGGTDDGSADDCSAPPDDGSSCRVAPGRERSRPSTLVWVLMPLGFLVGRRR